MLLERNVGRRTYYQDNKETILARSNAYYHANKEQINARKRVTYAAYFKLNKDAINKKNRIRARERRKSGVYKEKDRARLREWRLNNRDKQRVLERKNSLKRKYGLTIEQFDVLLKQQEYRCACCGSSSPGRKGKIGWAVDHCHDKNNVRAILCLGCNIILGHAKESVHRLQRVIDYLERVNKHDTIAFTVVAA